jgi:hypothetical protein
MAMHGSRTHDQMLIGALVDQAPARVPLPRTAIVHVAAGGDWCCALTGQEFLQVC